MRRTQPVLLGLLLAMPALVGLGAVGPPAHAVSVITELHAGYASGLVFPDEPDGFSGRLSLGLGGAVHSGLRLYGLLSVSYSALTSSLSNDLGSAEIDRGWVGITAGFRAVPVLAERVALLFDVGLGGALVSSASSINGGREQLESDDSAFVVEVGVGFQVRLVSWLSLGLRGELQIPVGFEDFDVLAEFSGVSSANAGVANFAILPTLTFDL